MKKRNGCSPSPESGAYQKCRVRVASYAKVATAAEYPAPFEPKKTEWDKPIPYIFQTFDTAPMNGCGEVS